MFRSSYAARLDDVGAMRLRPRVHGREQLARAAPQRRDLVLERYRRDGNHAPFDHAVALQPAQALRQPYPYISTGGCP
jgi:hypothetical protein